METVLKNLKERKAFALMVVIIAAVILTLLGAGLLQICFGVRVRAIKLKRETIAMLAAEAGYEQGIFWMSQQPDVLSGLALGTPGSSGTINFDNSHCDYEIQFHDFIGARPIFRILSTGYSGPSNRVVDVYVMQAVTGWDMGMCRIPSGTTSTVRVNFTDGEIINIPIHINKYNDSPDIKDIYFSYSGSGPQFLQKIEMGESRYAGGTDKYSSVMGFFEGGITFDQPKVKITDEVAVQSKVDRFRDSIIISAYKLTPVGTADVPNSHSAVQLEFFVDSGGGKVRITDNCTVRGYPNGVRDWRIEPGTGGTRYEKYDIYAYHYRPDSEAPVVCTIEDTEVTQTFAGIPSEPGGQIYVDGNVVIGSQDFDQMVVQGKLTVVATGNIWIADSIVVDGVHDADGIPDKDNQNVLGLIARGVIKVIDPGLADYGSPPMSVSGGGTTHSYVPVANGTTATNRNLPDSMVIEAAVTVGGGGWGAENVGSRKEFSGSQDYLVLIGSISEVVRGVVGIFGSDSDGYIKRYTIDERLLEGVLPGNIWFGGKYIPAPAGWHDYRL